MKLFKKKDAVYIALGSVLLFSVMGVLGVLMIDGGNALFKGMEDNILTRLLAMLRIKRINVYATIFVGFGLCYAGTVAAALLLAFGKKICAFLEKKYTPKHCKVMLWSVGVAVLIFGWVLGFGLCAMRKAKISHLFLVWLYFLLSLVCVGVVLVLLYILIDILSRAFKPNVKTTASGVSVGGGVSGAGVADSKQSIGEIFPGLKAIDAKYAKAEEKPIAGSDYNLSQIAEGFQAFLSERCELYYDLKMMRSFIAGMATSRLIILEGLSGTGKSSLPRYFCEYVGCKAFFAPVQSTWRDRSDVLGFYNDFSYVFKETNFLKNLYEASYTPQKFNLMVLDEMNLSRVEYYFADFLSVMEYPEEDWKVTIMPAINAETAPKKLSGGAVVVPVNTWFIGTANKDDSTFTITDKVYDRAVVLEFNDRNTKVQTTASPEPIILAPNRLTELFQEAKSNSAYVLTDLDIAKFNELAEFVYELFEIRFGNRIMNQILNFVPVYVALGGKKEEAIDIMFCRKVLHKLDGRFEEYIREGLVRLQTKIEQLYGAGALADTENMIRRLIKKLS